jgi:hypothetical protein
MEVNEVSTLCVFALLVRLNKLIDFYEISYEVRSVGRHTFKFRTTMNMAVISGTCFRYLK